MVEAEKESIWQKLANLDYRVIHLVGLLAILWITFFPLGIPVPVSEFTMEFYNTIENAPEGSTILIAISISPVSYPELAPGIRVSFIHALRNNLKVIIWFYGMEGPPLWQKLIKETPIPSGKEYGKDWVNLGFIPGFETAIAALASNIHETAPFDYYGTPIEDIPIMKNIKTGADIDLYYNVMMLTESTEQALRQFWAKFNTPVIVLGPATVFPMISPYYPEQVVAMVSGVRGGAEYELLVGLPWKGLAFTDSLSMVGLVIMIFVVIGNIGDIARKR